MKAIQIIEATEACKKLGFYEGECYEYVSNNAINERGDWITITKLLMTHATIKMVII